MRLLLFALLLLLAADPTAAAEKRKYAVLSIIGDRMLLAQHFPNPDATPGRNARDFLPIDGGVIDNTALLAVNQALLRLDPGNKPVLLKAQDASLFVAQVPMLDSGGDSRPLLTTLQGMLKGTGATHLILLTKHRAAARLRLHDRMVGSGPLEGVGFYLDGGYETRNLQTNEPGTGALWPFAYFRIELIELGRGEILREARVLGSTPYASARADNTWKALTGEQKVRALQDLVRLEIERILPTLLD